MELFLLVLVIAYLVLASAGLTLWMASDGRQRELERSKGRHPAGKSVNVDDAIRWHKEG